MSKKILSLALVAAFSLTLSACNKAEEKAVNDVMDSKPTENEAMMEEKTTEDTMMEENTEGDAMMKEETSDAMMEEGTVQ